MSIHRRAAKRDSNERAIIKAAEAMGFLVLQNSAKGRPDLCLLRDGDTYWAEVKMPGEALTLEQVKCFSAMRQAGVVVRVLESPGDARDMAEGLLLPWYVTHATYAPSQKPTRPFKQGSSRARVYAEQCLAFGCAVSMAKGSTYCKKHQPKEAK